MLAWDKSLGLSLSDSKFLGILCFMVVSDHLEWRREGRAENPRCQFYHMLGSQEPSVLETHMLFQNQLHPSAGP